MSSSQYLAWIEYLGIINIAHQIGDKRRKSLIGGSDVIKYVKTVMLHKINL